MSLRLLVSRVSHLYIACGTDCDLDQDFDQQKYAWSFLLDFNGSKVKLQLCDHDPLIFTIGGYLDPLVSSQKGLWLFDSILIRVVSTSTRDIQVTTWVYIWAFNLNAPKRCGFWATQWPCMRKQLLQIAPAHIMTCFTLWMSFTSCRWAYIMSDYWYIALRMSFLSQGQYIQRGVVFELEPTQWGNSCMPVDTTTCYTDRHNKTCVVTRYATGQDTTLSGSYGRYS